MGGIETSSSFSRECLSVGANRNWNRFDQRVVCHPIGFDLLKFFVWAFWEPVLIFPNEENVIFFMGKQEMGLIWPTFVDKVSRYLEYHSNYGIVETHVVVTVGCGCRAAGCV